MLFVHLVKNWRLWQHKIIYALFRSRKAGVTRLGGLCSWNVCLDGLNQHSVVVSAGVGNDISFEIELHRKTGAEIILLDPSPTGRETIVNTPPELLTGIKFYPYGLAAEGGVKDFILPYDMAEGSYGYAQKGGGAITFECRSLNQLMKENNFQQIDLLKMDIEGFEWEVLDSIFARNLKVRQIAVEFHALKKSRYGTCLWRYLKLLEMRLRGWRLIHHEGVEDHTFFKKWGI